MPWFPLPGSWGEGTRRQTQPFRSVVDQVALLLPRMYVGDVIGPLLALGGDEVLGDVVAEGFEDHLVLLQDVDRGVESWPAAP